MKAGGGARAAAAAIVAGAVVWTAPLRGQAPGDTMTVPIPGTDQALVLAWVPGGVHRIGSPEGEPGRDADEGPEREVRLDGFWMSVHEITADQYAPFRYVRFDADAGAEGGLDVDAVTRPSPPYEDPGHGLGTGDHPATGMTRYNALHYAHWLSLKTGRLFRLPTEAEWEAACRAGGAASAPTLEDRAWFDANAGGTHHPVGSRAPNAWGIHDLQGNVAEWVMDAYDAEAWATLAGDVAAEASWAGDPVRGPGVVRGGAYDDPAERLRCADRLPEPAAWKRRDPQIPKSRWWNTDSPHVGFRLVSPGGEVEPARIEEWFARILPP